MIQIAPNEVGGWTNRALSRRRQGRPAEALADYEQALRIAVTGAEKDLATAEELGSDVVDLGRDLLDLEGEMQIGSTLKAVLRMASKASYALDQELVKGAASRIKEAFGLQAGVGEKLQRLDGLRAQIDDGAARQARLLEAAQSTLTKGARAQDESIKASASLARRACSSPWAKMMEAYWRERPRAVASRSAAPPRRATRCW